LITRQKPKLVTVFQSCETFDYPPSVSIHLFQHQDENYDCLSAFIAGRNEDAQAPAKLLLIIGSHCPNVESLRDPRERHMFGRCGHQAGAFLEAVAGHLAYLFIDVRSLLSVRESPPFEILTLQRDIMAQTARVGASHFYFYFHLTRPEFNHVQDMVPQRFIPSFTFEQYAAFPSSYTRDVFSSLDSVMPGNPKFPFPDARSLSHDLADQIRKWAEIQPCEYCGAVLLRGMPRVPS
jgi:hypothetical protein